MTLYRKIQNQYDSADHKNPISAYANALLDEIKLLYLNGGSESDLQTWMNGGTSGKDMYWQYQLSGTEQTSFFQETYGDVFNGAQAPGPTSADSMYLLITNAIVNTNYSASDQAAFKDLSDYLNDTYNSSDDVQILADWKSGKILSSGFQAYYDKMDTTGQAFIQKIFGASPPPPPYTPPSSPPKTVAEALADAKAWQKAYDKQHPGGNAWINGLISALEQFPSGDNLDVLQGLGALLEDEGAAGDNVGKYSFKSIFDVITNTGSSPRYPVKQGAEYAGEALNLFVIAMPAGMISASDMTLVKNAITALEGGKTIQSVLQTLQASWSGGGLTAITNFLTASEAGAPPYPWPPTSPPTTLAEMQKYLDYYTSLNPTNRWVVAMDNAAHAPGVTMDSLQGYASVVEQWGMPASKLTMLQLLTNTQPGTKLTGQGSAYASEVLKMLGTYAPSGTISAESESVLLKAATSSNPLSYVQANLNESAAVKNSVINFLKSAVPVGPPSVWPPTSPPTTLAEMQKYLDYYTSLNPTNRWVVAMDNAAHAPGVTMDSLQGYASVVEQWGMPASKLTMLQLLTNTQPGTKLTGQGSAYASEVLKMLGTYAPSGTISATSESVLLKAAASSNPLSYVQANLNESAAVKNSVINFLKQAGL